MNFIFSIYFIFLFVSTRFFWELFTNLSFHARCIGEAQQFFYKNINKKLKKNDSLIGNFQIVEIPLTAWKVTSTC
jgi:hypothetical protein